MTSYIARIYDALILKRPLATLVVALLVIGGFATQMGKFKLDASGDSLVLEHDADLQYYRNTIERYTTSEILVLTYSTGSDLFVPETLADIGVLRDELAGIEGVRAVTTILDVPLLVSTETRLSDLADPDAIKTLETPGVDPQAVSSEFSENPLYHGRLLSSDGKTCALLVTLAPDDAGRALIKRRTELRQKKSEDTITAGESAELEQVSADYRRNLADTMVRERVLVKEVRAIIDRHRSGADIYLGGVPMIVADMISFVRSDLVVFGLGVLLFLILTLAIIFRKIRWVVLAILCCSASVVVMLGYLGMVDWRVTVISSNFVSLMLILTMALTIHLIQKFKETEARLPDADQKTLVSETVRAIVLPCLYTSLTTIVAFFSLLVSGIRPVMDFGMMMTIGIIVSFVIAFILFPATVALLKKEIPEPAKKEESPPFTLYFARFTEAHGSKILVAAIILAIASGVGISRLKVENRFIDYFRKNTAIYQGMSIIDRKLGGTTPLDIIIDFKVEKPDPAMAADDPFFQDDGFFADAGVSEGPSFWFADVTVMEEIEQIHDYLDQLPETGEVLSLATAGKLARKLNNDVPLDGLEFSILYKKSPEEIKDMLISPFVLEEPAQVRFTTRIVESDKKLERAALLARIRGFLVDEMGLEGEQVHFTGMFVLYNNMLASLYRSQILTIGLVFVSIMVMFAILFRSFYLALIAIVPNLLPAAMVLGVMGWLNIPLDMMTITIASITIGIAVDDTIHYIHRFQKEFPKDRDYLATVYRCHNSIGRAMYYTSVTIIIGFSILVLSNFVPTVSFGIFTGLAMVVALLAALTLLPQLLLLFKPLGPGGGDRNP